MIRRLRRRFIRIATLSVTTVMLLLTLLLNTANYISTTRELRDMLQLISSNQGMIPAYHPAGEVPAAPPKAPQPPRDGSFTAETPYSTRYFVLRYQDDGTLVQADLQNIASVTEEDITPYLAAAVAHGAGYGSYGSYGGYGGRGSSENNGGGKRQ